MIDKLEFGLHTTKDTTKYVKSRAVIVIKNFKKYTISNLQMK